MKHQKKESMWHYIGVIASEEQLKIDPLNSFAIFFLIIFNESHSTNYIEQKWHGEVVDPLIKRWLIVWKVGNEISNKLGCLVL